MSRTKAPAADVRKLSATRQEPLSVLVLNEDDNARSPDSVSKEGIESMASMLMSVGQLNPIIVSKRPDGNLTVHAGGRRLRAFWLLQQQGKIPADHPVDVREIDVSAGIDVSLIENISQEPMHPVDEFRAYKMLAEKGYTAEAVAKAFGQKVLHVKRRMKLADVHPQLLEQYRAGEIQLEQIMALASTDDQERQLLVWNALPTWHRANDQLIRRAIAEEEVSVDDPRVTLVGLENYLDAGGQVRVDLFSEKGKDEKLADVGLLHMLVAERLEAKAEQLRSEGWSWVEVLHSFGSAEQQLYKVYPPVYLPETPEQTAQREALEGQIDKKQDELETLYSKEEADEGDEADQGRLEAEIEAIEVQIDALEQSRLDLRNIDMTIAGAVVSLDNGQIVVRKPMLRAQDAKRLSELGKGERSSASLSASPKSETEQQAEGMSDRLIMNLTAQRTAAVQACLVQKQNVALAALAAHMAAREFDAYTFGGPIKISLFNQTHALCNASPTMADSPAQQTLNAEREALLALLPENSSDYLSFFMGQDLDVSLRVIAFCTALTVDGVRGKNATQDDLAPLAEAVALDMRSWWAPTSENYLALVPKAQMIEAVTDALGGPLATPDWDKLKKAEVLDRAVDALKGTGWLPPILR